MLTVPCLDTQKYLLQHYEGLIRGCSTISTLIFSRAETNTNFNIRIV